MQQLPRRLQSIDIFRAITMFLMIFVNDVDGVSNIPGWIKHVSANTDGLGFADTIFPTFLFIVGLSVPFALNKRMHSGESKQSIVWHIILRSLALIVMGFFHVNLESYDGESALLQAPVWEIFITLAFFLIWLDYKTISKNKQYILQLTGAIILITMAVLYKGESPHGAVWMQPHWWGILGLIGWAYLTCALIYLFTNGKLKWLIVILIFFLIYTMLNQTELLQPVSGILKYCWFLNGGSEVSLIMSGIIISVIYRQYSNIGKQLFVVLLIAGISMIVLGCLLRPFGGISKIHATPSWVGICASISILVFAFLIYLIDIRAKANWFKVIKPAGTSTLTCYLIPYFLYAFMVLFHINYPAFLSEGIGGLLRSFAVAFIVIFITGMLERKNLRLKI